MRLECLEWEKSSIVAGSEKLAAVTVAGVNPHKLPHPRAHIGMPVIMLTLFDGMHLVAT